MFPTRLYGALPRVGATALFLFVILVLAVAAHAAEINVFGRSVTVGAAPVSDEAPDLFGLAAPLDVFGGGISQGPVAMLVRAKAEALGVPAGLALAIARYESGGRCALRGRSGERGAMQVLPQTARAVGVTGNLYDCATGIEAGLRYLKLALAMHAADGWCAVASAYNAGTWRASRCTAYGRAVVLAAGRE